MTNHIPHSVLRENRADGSILLRSSVPLGPVARNVGEWLDHWATAAPDRTFIAERNAADPDAGWREVGYAEMRHAVRAVAAALLERGLGPDKPVLILSGNGVDHAILALAGHYVGIPVVPLADQYSLIPGAHDRLRYAARKVHPGLVFADDAAAFGEALSLDVFADLEKIAVRTDGAPVAVTPFDALLSARCDATVDEAHSDVGPETLAKILFTSGSTSNPKGVMTTHGMLTTNQAQLSATLPMLSKRPPKILDWLPWNHTFGGSHNFNLILANGGSLYIDNGRPMGNAAERSIRNLRQHPGTLSFNVPVGFSMQIEAMRRDPDLRKAYFENLDFVFYAAASLPMETWRAIEDFAREVRGEVPLMISGWGLTETAPAAVMVHEPVDRSGIIGVPLPEVILKLLPLGEGRYEIRLKGDNIMPGYYRDPAKSADAFDEEGFLITNDAVRFVDSDDPNRGLVFDGRITEDFKLSTGTWVRASNLRLDLLKSFSSIASDLVIAGHDRDEIGLLLFGNKAELASAGIIFETDDLVLQGEQLNAAVESILAKVNKTATGSSTRITRAVVMAEPPSVADGEITAKGSLNIRKILDRRAALVERLFDDTDPAVAHG
ncbi:feruloyl-CoA synthetase [Hwanghaeella grinnelliae]|uniref:Feruloyl-CoA synthetase n=1 Tax=Hwanghaeella grinnelliae TaxID=2500179 RepID=A0A437QPK1_9PROT|nr:feruloyl-CoA synthase [Hwanghaeella grinnelliae]RVU36424.1 feruloyl-CoA synthetase [Hwanghaeella grinnelliae]